MKTLKEKALEKGLVHLIENTTVSIKPEQIEIYDEEKLIESKESGNKSFPCRGVLKGVEVTKFSENDNGRVYSRELEEKIIKEKAAEGTLSLSGHPEGDGETDQIVGVWHEYRLTDTHGLADWYLTGSKGQDLLEAIQAGAKIGISRSGYGEFLEDGKTVNPKTYELERLGDSVIKPSQRVYASVEHLEQKETKNNEKKDENIHIFDKKNTNKISEHVDIINNEKIENNHKEVFKMDKIQEANFRNTVNVILSKAKKSENFTESIDELKRIDCAGIEDIKLKVDETVNYLQSKLDEAVKNSSEKLETVSKELESVKEENKVLSEKYEIASKIIEKNGLEKFEDVETLKENCKLMKEDLDDVDKIFETENFKKLEIENLKDVVDLAEDTILRDEDIEYLKEQNIKLKDDLKQAEDHIEEAEEELEKLGFTFEEEKDKKDDKDMKDDEMKDKEDKKEEEDDEEMKKKKDKKDKDMKDDEEDMEEKESKSKKKESVDKIIKYKFSTKDKDLANEIKETSEEKVEKIEEKVEDKIDKDIEEFYNVQVKKYPAIKEIKEDVLKSKSLIEAVDIIDEYKNTSEDYVKVDFRETKTPAWLNGRD